MHIVTSKALLHAWGMQCVQSNYGISQLWGPWCVLLSNTVVEQKLNAS